MSENFDSKKRVFLSYVSKDIDVANKIGIALDERGFRPWLFNTKILSSNLDVYNLEKSILTSDYIFILLSKNYKKQWEQWKDGVNYFDEQIKRNITIIPILLDDSEIPNYFLKFQAFDLRRQSNNQISRLIKQIELAPEIDFGKLSELDFEQLIIDLLLNLKFKILRTMNGPNDLGFDFEAEYQREDPFGSIVNEHWIVETKFYKKDRFSINSLRQLADSLDLINYEVNALLVTTSQLTSTAKNWLDRYSEIQTIRVIEGPELRRLLLKFPDLVTKYFSK